MDAAARNALDNDGLIDISTVGRRTGQLRRIEIGLQRVHGRYYLTGTPGKARAWYANLVAHPAFTLHLKQSVAVDLEAIARPITEREEREAIFADLLTPLASITSTPGTEPAVWIAVSPLIEVFLNE